MLNRIQSVDFVRVVAILAVIVIHTGPFIDKTIPRGSVLDFGLVLNQLMICGSFFLCDLWLFLGI